MKYPLKDSWTRRNFSRAVLYTQFMLACGVFSVSSGCRKSGGKSQNTLDEKLRGILTMAMDEIIPSSTSMPSASDAGGLNYIENILAENPELVQPLVLVLTEINSIAGSTMNQPYINLDRAGRIAVLESLENSKPEWFQMLRNFVYESYYINTEVWAKIGYQPYPTASTGPVMEPFDEGLLARVKQRPLSFKHI